MNQIDVTFVVKHDNELILQDMKLHARPFHVAIAWMKEQKFSGNFLDRRIWSPLMDIYHNLYPNGDFAMPPMMIGSVAFRDQIYAVRVNVGYGSFSVDPLELISIDKNELEFIFTHFPEQAWRGFYAACDVWDFGYGIDDTIKLGTPAEELLVNARSSLAATSRILALATDIDAVVQTTCLTAELAMKGALKHLGATDKDLKSFSHQLPKLAAALIAKKSTASDARLAEAASKFPDYVGTRYASHSLTRVQLMELAMRAQFVAAEAIRRISDRNMAGEMEARLDTSRRMDF